MFVQPLAILMLSFIMILLVFNTLLRIFIAEQAITAMQMQYALWMPIIQGKNHLRKPRAISLKPLM
ncbi:hypothetical protein [uncultured Streptococcus sp.]|uniref:hypothetical protein n=1 Tax=uncultured Streptococcus sp. TaxID=83427 RepID=UPI0026310446|nr:hypothetical protein [uncultured Streptococcus sp.]